MRARRPGLFRSAAVAVLLCIYTAAAGACSLLFGGDSEYQSCSPSDPSCQDLSPQQQQTLSEAQSVLLGTWRLEETLLARDEVDRLLTAGRVTYTLMIFSKEHTNHCADKKRWKKICDSQQISDNRIKESYLVPINGNNLDFHVTFTWSFTFMQ